MVGHLKDIFLDVLTLVLSAMITSIVLEYIYIGLKLRPPTQLYQELLDKLNFTYMVEEITKPKYKNLAFFISNSSGTSTIPKTMIFVDNIEDVKHIAVYLCLKLLSRLQDK